MSSAAEHRELAELYLEKLNKDSCRFDALWSQAMATAALAHATLAASEPLAGPGVITWMAPAEQRFDITTASDGDPVILVREGGNLDEVPGADELPEKIVFQGAAVKDYGPVGRLAKSESFTLRDSFSVREMLYGK